VTVDDVVVLNNVLARIEVETFNAFLGGFESLRDGLILNRGVFVDAEAGHEEGDAIALEDTHEIVFAADEELGCARVTLATTAAAELVVDAA
jgi:hypothetical protein